MRIPMSAAVLEVCVAGLEAAHLATMAGADRLELCQSLEVGGITPPMEWVPCIRKWTQRPIIVLVRCRGGDFEYDSDERSLMLDQAKRALQEEVDGIAVGASLPNRSLDWQFLDSIVRIAESERPGATLVLHRVFDTLIEPMHCIPKLIALGFHRILTSGGSEHALDSIDRLASLQSAFGETIEILPAGGIDSGNARQILTESGCNQLHGSMRGRGKSSGSLMPSRVEIEWVRRILDESI